MENIFIQRKCGILGLTFNPELALTGAAFEQPGPEGCWGRTFVT